MYSIDLEKKTIEKIIDKIDTQSSVQNMINFSYKDSMYNLVPSMIYLDNENGNQEVKDEYTLYKYDINTNTLDKIDFYDKYLKDLKLNGYSIVNNKIENNKLILILQNGINQRDLKFITINLDNDSVNKIDIKIPDEFKGYEEGYYVDIKDFCIKNNKLVLLTYTENYNYIILVFDINTSENIYSGYVNSKYYSYYDNIVFKE